MKSNNYSFFGFINRISYFYKSIDSFVEGVIEKDKEKIKIDNCSVKINAEYIQNKTTDDDKKELNYEEKMIFYRGKMNATKPIKSFYRI